MQIQQQLKSISSIDLSADESTILKWIRSVKWEEQTGSNEPIPHKAKVPEFFGGVRFFKVQGGGNSGAGAMGALDLFIKKIQYQGVISKQNLYPVTSEGNARFLTLNKDDLDNLGAGSSYDDDDYDE